ncbi:sugar kinase [Compostimonas suwonensis]|uniref:2-dehydro-3-deoxygluconokinase n=1 Tax=Compostimonas suwonensis TaxID=1048394 RepID=A0A2M9BBM5_9MICO|nr:sugar kinase [Compostimonas suwonensis]PJJ55361.1 2-dehydro-3-deoxygluconokinase [Compostimonas suwonensis]
MSIGAGGALPPNAAHVVAVGETMIMLVPEEGSTLAATRRFDSYIGGAESNVALYLARLGVPVRWASVMRNDPLGRRIATELAGSGVDVSAISWRDVAQTGLYLKDPGAESTAVYYYRQGSAARLIDPALWQDERLRSAAVLHLTGITPALSESANAAVEAAVLGRETGAELVSFDVNYRPGLWPVDVAAPVLRRLADASDLVFVGMDEAHHLWGCATPREVREMLPRARTVVVKDGAVGAYALSSGRETFVPSLAVDVVEPVGAGDAFAAGYLKSLLDGRGEAERLRLGHLLAATALTVHEDAAEPPSSAWLDAQLEVPEAEWASAALAYGKVREQTA